MFYRVVAILCLLGFLEFSLLPNEMPANPLPLSERFILGVEYMLPGLAEAYAKMGVRCTKSKADGFRWMDVELEPPKNGQHVYDWRYMDRLITEYQAAGFKHFHIYTEARNEWASGRKRFLRRPPSVMPKEENLKYYADYIRNMVERYDGDGKADMPGLRYPIRYWEIEAEWATFWHGTVEEYLRLIRIARQAAKEADPHAKIILVGLLMLGWFDGDLTNEQLESKFYQLKARHQKLIRKAGTEIQELLKHQELFDIIEFHSLSDWTEIIATVRFLRQEMRKNGYDKPIWAGDANYSLNPMMLYGKPWYPYEKEQKPAILKAFKAMKKKRHPRHNETLKWFRAEQANFTAKKLICAMGEGLAGMNIGQTEDCPVFRPITRITGTFAFTGLIDLAGYATHKREKINKRIIWSERIAGEPRPVYWTLKMLLDKLGPYRQVKRLRLGPGIYAYRFSEPALSKVPSNITALWYEDGKGQLPGDVVPETKVTLAIDGTKATLIPLITEIGQKTPKPRSIPVQNGSLSLVLTESPVLISPEISISL